MSNTGIHFTTVDYRSSRVYTEIGNKPVTGGRFMTVSGAHAPQITYDEAADILGIKRDSVKQLVARGHLHSVPAPEDRRRRRLLRSEVLGYQQAHAGKWSYDERGYVEEAASREQAPVPPELVNAGLAGASAVMALIAAFRGGSDATARILVIGAIIALALLLLLEWDRQGKVDTAKRRRLERMAKDAESGVATETFIDELEALVRSTALR
jgi:excisionase family DNA binding protein